MIQIFHPFLHSLIDHSTQGWASLKPGDRNSIYISHMGGRNTKAQPSSAGSWIKQVASVRAKLALEQHSIQALVHIPAND